MRDRIRVIETDMTKGKLLREAPELVFRADKEGNDGQEQNIFNVYDEVEFQEILGFGGAFTQASAANFRKMKDEMKDEAADRYFSADKGIGYSFCRVCINSSDYSEDFRTYDEVEGDVNLEHFDLGEDRDDVIPMMKAALERCPELKVFASPWSAPAWMKTNGKMENGGHIRREYRQTWALYYAKFIKAFEEEGVPIWGMTVQNEAKALQWWESCEYTAAEERDFVTGFLRPTLEREGLGDRKIFNWDHNKERAVDRALVTYGSPRARAAFDGEAVHWYSGDHFRALECVHALFPEKMLIATEQCSGNSATPYQLGEQYMHDILGDLNNYCQAWVDWNMLLDETGHPYHWDAEQQAAARAQGHEPFCSETPIIYDRTADSLKYMSSYYYIGQISRYVRPGSHRIGSSIYTDELEGAAFKNTSGTIAAVLMNRTEKERKVTLRFKEKLADYVLAPHSIVTFVF